MRQLLQAFKKCMPRLQDSIDRGQSNSIALYRPRPDLSRRHCSLFVRMQITVGAVSMGGTVYPALRQEVQSITCQLRPALVTTQSLSSGMLNSMAAPLGPMR